MSKYVKNLISDHLRNRLQGVDSALLVNMIGMNANANNRLRRELKAKNIEIESAAFLRIGHEESEKRERRSGTTSGVLYAPRILVIQ